MNKNINKFAFLEAKTQDLVALKNELNELSRLTTQESACVEFMFYQYDTKPDKFILKEKFVHQEGYRVHLAAHYTQSFFAKDLVSVKEVIVVDELGGVS